MSLADMDMSRFKKGATYEAIKDYVKEQTGYKVSSLYIAQVKAKHGLDMRENFNLPKSEDAGSQSARLRRRRQLRML